jgi:hypothetical protein
MRSLHTGVMAAAAQLAAQLRLNDGSARPFVVRTALCLDPEPSGVWPVWALETAAVAAMLCSRACWPINCELVSENPYGHQ